MSEPRIPEEILEKSQSNFRKAQPPTLGLLPTGYLHDVTAAASPSQKFTASGIFPAGGREEGVGRVARRLGSE